MKGDLVMRGLKGKECLNILMGKDIRGIGKMGERKEKGRNPGWMEVPMSGNIRVGNRMGAE